MVSRILISIALLCSSVAMSQEENGLTFSQVLLIELDSGELFEVPEGKVWKIVSAVVNPPSGYYDTYFFVNNNSFSCRFCIICFNKCIKILMF